MSLYAKYVVAIAVVSTTTLAERAALASGENMLPPFGHTVFCQTYPADCKQSGSARLFADTPARRAELDTVNRHVNASIAPQAAASYSIGEKWLLSPVEGRCTDYAVTKRHNLLQKGWPSSSLLLAEVTLKTGEHHLILVVYTEGGEFILDNLDPNVRSLAQAKSEYYWDRIESPTNPKRWESLNITGELRSDPHARLTMADTRGHGLHRSGVGRT
jgi:predicted transglutaminase-like cysteine proteinase